LVLNDVFLGAFLEILFSDGQDRSALFVRRQGHRTSLTEATLQELIGLTPSKTDSVSVIFTNLLGPLDFDFALDFGTTLDRFVDENTAPAVTHLLRPFVHEYPNEPTTRFIPSMAVSTRNPSLWRPGERCAQFFHEIPIPHVDAHQHPYAEFKMMRDIPTLAVCRPKYIPSQLPTIACLHAPKYAELVAAARTAPVYAYSVDAGLWVAMQGEPMHRLKPHLHAISALGISDCGELVLSCDIRGNVRVQKTSGQCQDYQQCRYLTTACSFSPKMPHEFVVGTLAGVIFLYVIGRVEIQRVFCGHTAGIVKVLIHANGEFVGSTSCDGTMRLWSITQGTCVRLFKAAGTVPTSLRFSHSGRWMMSTANDGTVAIIDAGSGKLIKTFKASDSVLMNADFSNNDELVVGYDRMGTFFVWETNEAYGCQLATVRIDRVRVVAFDCLPNDEFRIVGCSKQ
jgi:hypothetical protein